MGRMSSFYEEADRCKRLEISNLRRWGLLQGESTRTGEISWSIGGKMTSQALYQINMGHDPHLLLFYQIKDQYGQPEDILYKIKLVSVPSNLGKGIRWYFVCPFCGRRASVLYLLNGSKYFRHRLAYEKFFYYSQLVPVSMRPFKFLIYERKVDEIKEARKRIIRYYNGKPTRIQRRLWAYRDLGDKNNSKYKDFY